MTESSISFSSSEESLLQSLASSGWCFGGQLDHVKALITIHSALHSVSTVDSIESELCNMDLRSIGGTSLPDPSILRKSAHLLPPKVLQIASVRDVSRSSFADGSRGSSNRRLLKMALTDGQTEITAIEYSFISSLPDDVVPGTKIRLEKKAMIRSGIVCLSPDVITVLGGVVQSLHEEWQMNQKYAGFSRSSLRIVQEGDAGGPPPFEKLKIGGPKRGSAQDASRNTGSPLVESCKTSEVKLTDRKQEPEVEADIDNDLNTTRLSQKAEEKPSSSETRPKEVAEFVPLQNQAAAQKLLQRMNHPNQRNRQNGGKKYRGKGKEKETPVFTLDEWERRKAGAIPLPKAEAPGVSNDEYLAWQLQNQFDLEDQVQGNPYQGEAENIKMSVFSFERDGGGGRGRSGLGGRGRGRARGRGGGEAEGDGVGGGNVGGRGRGRARGRGGGEAEGDGVGGGNVGGRGRGRARGRGGERGRGRWSGRG